MISSDSFVPYPKRIGSQVGNGQVAGGPVAGILAGGPPAGSSPASNPSLPIAVTDTLVNYTPNPSTSPPQPVSPPVGAIDSLKYIQVINTGPGFVLVIQGSFLGITPPFAACRYTLSGVPGLPVNLTGWDGGYPAAVGKNAPVFILWSSNQFSNDLSWEGPSSSGGGGFVGVPFSVDFSNTFTGLMYNGFGSPGTTETWSTTFSAFSHAIGPGVTAGKDGTATVNIDLTSLTVSGAAAGSSVSFWAIGYSLNQGAQQVPFDGASSYYGVDTQPVLMAALSTVVVTIQVTQPAGSSPLGSGGVVLSGAVLQVTQTQLQS